EGAAPEPGAAATASGSPDASSSDASGDAGVPAANPDTDTVNPTTDVTPEDLLATHDVASKLKGKDVPESNLQSDPASEDDEDSPLDLQAEAKDEAADAQSQDISDQETAVSTSPSADDPAQSPGLSTVGAEEESNADDDDAPEGASDDGTPVDPLAAGARRAPQRVKRQPLAVPPPPSSSGLSGLAADVQEGLNNELDTEALMATDVSASDKMSGGVQPSAHAAKVPPVPASDATTRSATSSPTAAKAPSTPGAKAVDDLPERTEMKPSMTTEAATGAGSTASSAPEPESARPAPSSSAPDSAFSSSSEPVASPESPTGQTVAAESNATPSPVTDSLSKP
ncbi:MAG: hypothetical protein ACKO0Z_09645, partial [Betaproteobacteria bacterium]